MSPLSTAPAGHRPGGRGAERPGVGRRRLGRGGRLFGTSMGDIGNDHLVALGTIHALYHRERTGHGQQFAPPSSTRPWPWRRRPTSARTGRVLAGRAWTRSGSASARAAGGRDRRRLAVPGRADRPAHGSAWREPSAGPARRRPRVAACLEEAFSGHTAKNGRDPRRARRAGQGTRPRFGNPHDGQPALTFSATPARCSGLHPRWVRTPRNCWPSSASPARNRGARRMHDGRRQP